MQIGDVFGEYSIEAELGQGGVGIVYRARSSKLGRVVALKVLSPELSTDEVFRRRFLQEAKLAASIDHPNVVPIYDVNEVDDQLFIAMRLVAGSDLGEVLTGSGPLELARLRHLLDQAALGLDVIHRVGLIIAM